MPFLVASTPVRSGVVRARRAAAAACPVVGGGCPGGLRLCGSGRATRRGSVLQPYLTGRRLVRERRRTAAHAILGGCCSWTSTSEGVVRRDRCAQHREGSLGAIFRLSRESAGGRRCERSYGAWPMHQWDLRVWRCWWSCWKKSSPDLELAPLDICQHGPPSPLRC